MTKPIAEIAGADPSSDSFSSSALANMAARIKSESQPNGQIAPIQPATVAQVLVQMLVDAGATHVFGGHGGAVIPLIEAIEAHPKLEWVYTRNEGGAALAGAALAKLKAGNGIGVVIGTSGPGATHLTTGLVAAYKDNLSLVALTGLKPSYKSGLTDFQDIENARLFAGVLDFSRRVMHPVQAPQLMRDALAHAITRRTTVHLAVPEDIQATVLEPQHHLAIRHFDMFQGVLHGPACSDEDVARAVRFFRDFASMRIVVAVGHLAVGAGAEVTELAELLNAPMVTRLDAKGAVDESHSLCLGVVGIHGNPGLEASRDILESADCVVAVGVEEVMQGQMVLQDGAQARDLVLIMPDTATFSGRFMLSGCLIGNLRSSLRRLTAALRELPPPAAAEEKKGLEMEQDPSLRDYSSRGPPVTREQVEARGFPIQLAWEHYQSGQWRLARGEVECQKPRSRYKPEVAAAGGGEATFCHPSFVYDALNARLGPKDTLSVDVGDQTLWASFLAHLTRGTRTLSDEFMGTMGYALPAAIAASLHAGPGGGGGVHVGVAGDGAFQMTLNELATAVQHRCRIVMVVFCNGALGRVKFGFGAAEIAGTQIANPDYVALAKAYGAGAARVEQPAQAEAAVEAAFRHPGVFVIEVALDPTLRAEMAKVHDMRPIAGLAAQLGELLPDSMAQLRRPQALTALLEHFDNTKNNHFTEADLERIRAALGRWREEFAAERLGGRRAVDSTADDAELTKFLMERIHKLRRVEFSLGAGPQAALQPGVAKRPAVVTFKGAAVPSSSAPLLEDCFPGAYPANFVKDALGIALGDPAEFAAAWRAAARRLFAEKPGGTEELEEFLTTGASNGRELKWTIMDILPNRSFPLHAHANIEVIHVLRGKLHELRLAGAPPTRTFACDAMGNPVGPDLSKDTWTFERRAVAEGGFLVNEVGSVHQSFTEDDPAVLLVLWAGCHANVTRPRMPCNPIEAGFKPIQLMSADAEGAADADADSDHEEEQAGSAKDEEKRMQLMRRRSLVEADLLVSPLADELGPELKAHGEVLLEASLEKAPSVSLREASSLGDGGDGIVRVASGLERSVSMTLGAYESVEVEMHNDGTCTCCAKDLMFLTT